VIDVERTCIDQQRAVVATEHRRHLIHHAARHAGESVLGSLGEEGQLDVRELRPDEVAQGHGHDAFQRRARRQAGADGHVR
jgi:hypothetical protein